MSTHTHANKRASSPSARCDTLTCKKKKTRLGETISPPERTVKGRRTGRGEEMLRPPSRARALRAAWRVTRLSPTPAHLCLSARLHTDRLSSYFRRLHYSSEQTHAGKVLALGLHTCAQRSEGAAPTRFDAIRDSANQKPDKSKHGSIWKFSFYYLKHFEALKLENKGAILHTHTLTPKQLLYAVSSKILGHVCKPSSLLQGSLVPLMKGHGGAPCVRPFQKIPNGEQDGERPQVWMPVE